MRKIPCNYYEFGPVVQEMFFKIFLVWSSGEVFVQRSGSICAILVEYHEEQFCEIILNLDQWFRGSRLKYFLSGFLAALLFTGAEPFMQF